jgi:hypothetical protein
MKRYPASAGTQTAKAKRSGTSVPEPVQGTFLSTMAVPAPIAFFEIKTSGSLARDDRSASPPSSIELTRPDGWVLRASGDVAKELAPTVFGQFFTTLQRELT